MGTWELNSTETKAVENDFEAKDGEGWDISGVLGPIVDL